MQRAVVTLLCLTLAVVLVGGARAVAGGALRPASAAGAHLSTADSALGDRNASASNEAVFSPIAEPRSADGFAQAAGVDPETAQVAPRSAVPTEVPTEPTPEARPPEGGQETAPPVEESARAPAASEAAAVPVSASVPTAAARALAPVAPVAARVAPTAVPVVAPAAAVPTTPPAAPAPAAPAPAVPVAPAVVAAPPAAACAATWFCYPRLGIAGPIVPYSDCLGSTDIGNGIRSFSCISPFYLMGHAYTQFGAIAGWQVGDVVFASGRRFVIGTSFVQNSCEPPAGAAAPLSLQTSLSTGGCGRVLVVQGR